jgi:hypothetical protein
MLGYALLVLGSLVSMIRSVSLQDLVDSYYKPLSSALPWSGISIGVLLPDDRMRGGMRSSGGGGVEYYFSYGHNISESPSSQSNR